jgi:cell wall-associated NlpC family hydrolase
MGERIRASMVALETLQAQLTHPYMPTAYTTAQPLNLYDSPTLQALATQVQAGRQLRFKFVADLSGEIAALPVVLAEDNYPGWLALADLEQLHPAAVAYRPPNPSLSEIQARIPQVIAFAQTAMAQPNHYLWGGTIGPHYDCSGLVQHAFAAQGIWLPRDAYQQETFVQPLQNPGEHPQDLTAVLSPGDLIFFGTPVKATHVALYLGDGTYIHSSGKDQGRNGIGIDSLSDPSAPVSRNYYAQVRGAGRVVCSYLSQEQKDEPA